MNSKITLPANKIRAALCCAGKTDVRFYLNSVHLEPNGERNLRLVATDGHILLAQQGETDEPHGLTAPMTIPRSAIEPHIKKSEMLDIEVGEGGALTLTFTGPKIGTITVSAQAVDATYPQYRNVIPTTLAPFEAGHFDPALMVKLAAAFQELHVSKKPTYPTLIQQGAKSAAVMVHPDHAAVGLIMPGRMDGWNEDDVNAKLTLMRS